MTESCGNVANEMARRALLVAATSQEEKDKWLEDILQAVQGAKVAVEDAARFNYYSLKSCSTSSLVALNSFV